MHVSAELLRSIFFLLRLAENTGLMQMTRCRFSTDLLWGSCKPLHFRRLALSKPIER